MQEQRAERTEQRIAVREVTHMQASWTEGERGAPGYFTVQLILDNGAEEYVLHPTWTTPRRSSGSETAAGGCTSTCSARSSCSATCLSTLLVSWIRFLDCCEGANAEATSQEDGGWPPA
jgi:hypothetical protein